MVSPSDVQSSSADRILTIAGTLGLAIVTLIYPAGSQIYAEPISHVFALLLAVPVIAVLIRSATTLTWPIPQRGWLFFPILVGLSILLSAWLSPYQATVLRWSALPLAGIVLFFWAHGWIYEVPATRPEKLMRALAIAVAIFTLVSLAQWVQSIVSLGLIRGFTPELWAHRNAYPLGHSNYTAGGIIMGLPFLVGAAARAQGGARTGWIVITLLAIFCLFTTGSRSGFVGLALLGGFGLRSLGLKPKQLAIVGLVGVLAFAALAFTQPRIRGLLAASDPAAPSNISSVQRLAMLEAGFRLGMDRPVMGWGLHSTPLVYPRYRAQLPGGAENVLQLHSAPVEIWSGLGGLGLLACAGLLGLTWFGWKRNPTAAIALIGYAGFALTDYQLDLPILVVAVALIGALLARPNPRPLFLTRAPRVGIAVALVGTVGLVLLFGREDPAPRLNAAALTLAQEPQFAERATALLEESLRLNPDQEIAHFNLGWLLVVAAPSRAESHFRAAAQLVPDKGGVYFGLGLARLNQDAPHGAAEAFALECLNDPAFLRSPWWKLPAIAAHREETRVVFLRLLDRVSLQIDPTTWVGHQIPLLRSLAPLLGEPLPGPENAPDTRS